MIRFKNYVLLESYHILGVISNGLLMGTNVQEDFANVDLNGIQILQNEDNDITFL